jgi:pimeloyl-ACP methyl ester carboxylesterase
MSPAACFHAGSGFSSRGRAEGCNLLESRFPVKLICVHGLSGSPRWWRPVLPAFEERNEVHLLDLRRVRPHNAADLVAAHVDEADVLIGHSLGGLFAAQVATLTPLRKLVLVAPAGVPTGRPLSREALALAATLRTVTPRFLPLLTYDAMRWGPLALARGGFYALGTRVHLERIAVPTLVVWGERDALSPVQLAPEWRDGLPDARLALIERAGHVPMYENPSAFVRVVLDFLEEPRDEA